VKEVREKKDKDKSRLRFWDMAGSKMGQITGLTNEEQGEAQKRAEEQVRTIRGHGGAALSVLTWFRTRPSIAVVESETWVSAFISYCYRSWDSQTRSRPRHETCCID
jgi:hypothetical protein